MPLSDLLSQLEQDGDVLVLIKEADSQLYLDTYAITSSRYQMKASELKTWLASKGIGFSVHQNPVNMVLIR
jgi:hypothetical protein